MYELEKTILPEFPSTQHLPLEPNATSDDKIASVADLRWLLAQPEIIVEEKVDGANSGIALHNGQPLIRNRSKILNKSYQANGNAKVQFSAIWTWWYENQFRLEALEKMLGFAPSIYGEWMYARHVVEYDQIPDWWIAYDIFDPTIQEFLDPTKSRELLTEVGFTVVPLVAKGQFTTKELLEFRDGMSEFASSSLKEGIYIKVSDGEKLTARFKMVAPWFASDPEWTKKPLIKNGRLRTK